MGHSPALIVLGFRDATLDMVRVQGSIGSRPSKLATVNAAPARSRASGVCPVVKPTTGSPAATAAVMPVGESSRTSACRWGQQQRHLKYTQLQHNEGI